MPIPRTQLYRVKETSLETPEVSQIMRDFNIFSISCSGGNIGRAFDIAMAIHFCDLKNKVVAEFGARGSLFGPFVSDIVKQIYVSDDFRRWKMLKFEDYWFDFWPASAKDPTKIIVQKEDMQKLSYPDKFFDVITCFSAIEHATDDIKCAQEIGRVLKIGGTAIISTEFGETFNPNPISRKYTKKIFIERIVKPSGLTLDDVTALDWFGAFLRTNYRSAIIFLERR